MKTIRPLLSLLLVAAFLCAGAAPVYAATPVAASFSTAVPVTAQSVIQLQGSDADSTPLTYATTSSPSHGALSNLNTSTGAVVYTPTAGYTGSDSFTYTVTSDGDTSSAGTVTITVTSAKTRVIDTFTNPDSTPRQGKVSFFLSEVVSSPSGLIPAKASVTCALNSSGQCDLSLYPSTALNPVRFYQAWYYDTNGSSQLLGIYNIPASTTTISLSGHRVTDANLAAQYTFASKAEVDALTAAVAAATTAQLYPGLTSGKHVLWNGANFANSLVSESGSTVTVGGNESVTGNLSVTGTLSATGGIWGTLSNPTIAGGNISSPAITNPNITGGTATGTTLVSPAISNPVITGGALSLSGDITAGGTVTADAFVGNGAGLTGLTGATGGVSNTGSTTLGADAEPTPDGVGVIDLQTRNVTRLRVNNEGTIALVGGLEEFERASLPVPCAPSRLVRVTDSIRGLWRCDASGASWSSLTGHADPMDWKGVGRKIQTTGSVTSGSLTVNVSDSSFAAALFPGAGIHLRAGSNRYTGTVLSVAGSAITLSGTAPSWTNASATVWPDDNVAVNATIAAVFNDGGGTVYGGDHYFRCNPVALNSENAVLSPPRNPNSAAPITVRLEGEYVSRTSENTPSDKGFVIDSRVTGSGTQPATLSARAWEDTGSDLSKFNYVNFELVNVKFRDDPAPTKTAVMLHNAIDATLDSVQAEPDSTWAAASEPTTDYAAAFYMPGINNHTQNVIRNSSTYGYNTGLVVSECTVIDNFISSKTKRAILVESGNAPVSGTALLTESPVMVDFSTATKASVRLTLSIERWNPATAGAEWWADAGETIKGAAVARGKIEYHMHDGVTGATGDDIDAPGRTFRLDLDNLDVPTVEAQVAASAPQSISNNTYETVGFDLEMLDTVGGSNDAITELHTTTSNNGRFTVARGGTFYLGTAVPFDPNGTGKRCVRFYKNNTTQIWEKCVPANASDETWVVIPERAFTLAKGDYVLIQGYQNSGGALSTYATTSSATASIRMLR